MIRDSGPRPSVLHIGLGCPRDGIDRVGHSFADVSRDQPREQSDSGQQRHANSQRIVQHIADTAGQFDIHEHHIYVLNFRPNIPDLFSPAEEIIDNGFGFLSIFLRTSLMTNTLATSATD